MVEFKEKSIDDSFRCIIRPNASLTWHQVQLWFAAIAFVSMTIASVFALMGAWLILPFAGLEMLALAVTFYLCARRGQLQEVITVQDGHIVIERGRDYPQLSYKFYAAWSKIVVKNNVAKSNLTQVVLRAHGKELEIGRFLGDDERKELAHTLSRWVNGIDTEIYDSLAFQL